MRNRRLPLLLLLAVVAYSLTTRGRVTSVLARSWPQESQPKEMAGGMSGKMAHMYMTSLRQPSPGDIQRADAIVAAAKAAMAPYQDYRKALADGYKIFLPNIPQPQYHFTNYEHGLEARRHFDPSKPTSLLYRKTSDGGYKLVGVMYTDRVDASEEELNERIPLGVARWHQHINFCKAPMGKKLEYFGPHAQFGLLGSITTKEACEAAGGEFYPHVLGWMVHVYPYETEPERSGRRKTTIVDTTTWTTPICRA